MPNQPPQPQSQSILQLTPEETQRLWSPDNLALSPAQLEKLPEVKKWFTRRKVCPLSSFLVGKPVTTLAKENSQSLAADVVGRFRPAQTAVLVLQMLNKLFDRGNADGIFSLCPPPLPVLLRRRPSPFVVTRMESLNVASWLRELLAQDINSPYTFQRSKTPEKQLAEIVLGQVLLSAVVHGGLVNNAVLEQLVIQLSSAEPILQCLGDRVYVELSVSWRKQVDAEFRRWFPDELTAMLLMRLPHEVPQLVIPVQGNGDIKKVVWRAIRQYLLHNCSSRQQIPSSLTQLIDAVRLDFETRIPIMLVNYASRIFVSHSLKPHVWRRLHHCPDIQLVDGTISAKHIAGSDSTDTNSIKDNENPDEIEPRWLSILRKSLQGQDRDIIIEKVEALLLNPERDFAKGLVGELFAGFALWIFSLGDDYKVRFGVKTARTLIISVGSRIGGLIGATSVDDYDSPEWTALYEEALADAETSGVRQNLSRILREFQRYLETERGIQPIDATEVLGVTDGLVPVDANIITEEEFVLIRDKFTHDLSDISHSAVERTGGEALAEIGWLILTLSYRCGLRRMEVLKLKLSDVMIKHPKELLVRPSESRRLKSKSATRKLPLYALMDTIELERLCAWVNMRRADEAKKTFSEFLFALKERAFAVVQQDAIFKNLHEVMREVTGDPTVRFHHLRHTFASRTFLSLASTSLKNTDQLKRSLTGFKSTLDDALNFRIRLYGNDHMTRRDIWVVSSLLGHSGPDVSLEHYIHFIDLILAEELAQHGIAPRNGVVLLAAEKTAAHAHPYQNGSNLHSWIAHYWRMRYSRKVTADEPPVISEPVLLAEDSAKSNSPAAKEGMLRIWRLILIQQTKGTTTTELARRWRVDQENLERYIANAKSLADLTTSSNSNSYRHRFMNWVPDKRHPEIRQRTICPIKPHLARDWKIIELLTPKLREVVKNNKSFVDRVFLHYAQHSRESHSGMIFMNPDQPEAALDFMKWLTSLGLQKQDIHFVSYDITTKRSKFSAAWKKALGLRSSDMIDKAAPPNGRKDWACPWLGITPVFDDESGNKSGSAGFRFLMVMTTIVTANRSVHQH